MPTPVLVLDIQWQAKRKQSFSILKTELGDNYDQLAIGGSNSLKTSWDVTATNLSDTDRGTLDNFFSTLKGNQSFIWQPNEIEPLQSYTCKGYRFSPITVDGSDSNETIWSFSATFESDDSGECEAYRDLIDENILRAHLAGAIGWFNTYTRDAQPNIASSQYLIRNSFHSVLGRGGYFHQDSGTSEAQFITIKAFCQAYKQTGIEAYRTKALQFATAALTKLYTTPIPPANGSLWLPHWLFAVKGGFFFKGKKHPTNYLRDGYFDIPVSFTGGVGFISTGSPNNGDRLSNVYSLYDSKLLYKNVYAPVIFGNEYAVEYWVTNTDMKGVRYRNYPDSDSSGGAIPLQTTEPAGKIKLVQNYTSTLKACYSAYTTEQATDGQKYDAYPLWRSLYPKEANFALDTAWWIDDSYQYLYEITGDTNWLLCRDANRNSVVTVSNIPNLTHWYKKDTKDDDPFSYPGSQVVQIDNGQSIDTKYTATKALTGTFAGWLRVDVQSIAENRFPSCEFQNYAVQAILDKDSSISVQAASNRDQLLEITVSTVPNSFDFSQTFIAHWLIAGDSSPKTKTFLPQQFIRWGEFDKPYLVWHSTLGNNPVYTYSGLGGSIDAAQESVTVPYKTLTLPGVVQSITMNQAGGYAGFGLVLIGKPIRKPPRIFFRLVGQALRMLITDGSGYIWEKTIQPQNWQTVSYNWDDFEYSSKNTESNPGEPQTENAIAKIEWESLTPGDTNFYVYWVAEDDRHEPERFSLPQQTYKAAVVTRLHDVGYTFWVGDFKPVNTPSDDLRWNGQVVPFTANLNNGVAEAWQGAGIPLMGYQSAYHTRLFHGDASGVTEALKASQGDYGKTVGITGGFAPAYTRNYWDGADYFKYGIDAFIWESPDPNTGWVGYQMRPLEWTARALYSDPSNKDLRLIVTRGLGFIDGHFLRNNTNRVPTNWYRDRYPETLYHEPHAVALVGRAAIYGNLANMSPGMTYRVLTRCYQYVVSQYIETGLMAGSWSKDQPNYIAPDGQTYKEMYSFWMSEIIEFYSMLLQYKDQLKLPACGVNL